MSVDDISELRRDLAFRVVVALDLPTSIRLPQDTEVLVGLELGGVPLATAVALQTGLPWALLRRTKRANTRRCLCP